MSIISVLIAICTFQHILRNVVSQVWSKRKAATYDLLWFSAEGMLTK